MPLHKLQQKFLPTAWFLSILLHLAAARYSEAPYELPLTASTLFAPFKYHHHANLDDYSSFSSLEFLAGYEFGSNGTFEVEIDINLALNSSEDAADRVLFHLLVCDELATETIANITALYRPTITYNTGKPEFKTIVIEGSGNGTHPDMHCAMANRTLDYYCKSYPLENQSSDKLVYQSTKIISGFTDSLTSETEFAKVNGTSGSSNLMFYIDACELLGGHQSILRSCLEKPPQTWGDDSSLNTERPCFYCPENYPNRSEAEYDRWAKECVQSPPILQPIEGTVAMNLCTASGDCLRQPDSDLVCFYQVYLVLWGVVGILWRWHMRRAEPGTVLQVHRKLAWVPVVQVVYSAFALAASSTAGSFTDWHRGVLPTLAMALQFLALVMTMEVLMYIAKGWGVTRPSLPNGVEISIRVLVVTWATTFMALKQLRVEHMALVAVSGTLWLGIYVISYYWASSNYSRLQSIMRLALLDRLDPAPISAKRYVFKVYRWMLWGYAMLGVFAAAIGSTYDNTESHVWRWMHVQALDVLNLYVFLWLFHILQCRAIHFGSLDGLETGELMDLLVVQIQAVNESQNLRAAASKRKRIVAAIAIINPDNELFLGVAYVGKKRPASPALKQHRPRNNYASVVPVNS